MIRVGELAETAALRGTVLGWRSLAIASDADPLTRHFVAELDGEVVGCASCGPERFPAGDMPAKLQLRFWGVAVLDSHRGQRLGHELMAAVTARAEALGSELLWANARESALAFYVSLGFELAGDEFVDALSGLTDRRVVLRPGQFRE